MNNAKSRLKQITRGRQNSNHARFNIIFRELGYLQGALADAESDLKQNCVADLAPPIENLIGVIETLISELQIKAKEWGQELTYDQKLLKAIALEYSNFEWMFEDEPANPNKIYPAIVKNAETIAKHLKCDLKQFERFLSDLDYLENALTEANNRTVDPDDPFLMFSIGQQIEDIETEIEDTQYTARFWAGIVEHDRTLIATIEANYQGVDWVFDQCGLD